MAHAHARTKMTPPILFIWSDNFRFGKGNQLIKTLILFKTLCVAFTHCCHAMFWRQGGICSNSNHVCKFFLNTFQMKRSDSWQMILNILISIDTFWTICFLVNDQESEVEGYANGMEFLYLRIILVSQDVKAIKIR